MYRLAVLFGTAVVLPWVAASAVNATEIEHVEPPFWWQGFEHRELQLMVHGDGIADFEPMVELDGVAVAQVVRTSNPNYLFVYLTIDPSAPTGDFDIVFSNDGETLTHRYSLLERNTDPGHVEGFTAADVIYLITPDRFANGDPSNDSVEGYADPPDRSEPYGRHGGDIAGLEASLDYIADMGFTQIWLNPLLENAMDDASYHGYATTDFYKVDPRYGSNESYRDFVAAARGKGVGVIMDIIPNHMGSGHWWMDDLPTGDWLNYQDDFILTTHARTSHQDPYAAEIDKQEHTGGWFAPTMPDLNQTNALLGDYLVQNAIWWVEYLGLSGIRIDTYPYPDKDYMTEWTRRIMREYPDINMVGEEWSPNPNVVSYWQAGKDNHDGYRSYLPSVFDFPLQIALSEALTGEEKAWGSVWTPVYEMLGNDYLYPDPFNLVIFPDNHDMSRIYTQLDEDVDLTRMSIAFYLTMRGIPQIYYGTEILMSHPGTDSHGAIRADFPGGWEGDRVNAFTGRGLNRDASDMQEYTKKLLNWRKQTPVVHTGKLMHFAPVRNVYAYFRYDDDDTVMVIFNRGDDAATVDMQRYAQRIGASTNGVDVVSGRRYSVTRDLVMEPRSVLILELETR